MFKENVGTVDRAIRIALGFAILVAFVLFPNAWWRWYTLIGIVPLVTGLFGTCPLYSLFGLSTCSNLRV